MRILVTGGTGFTGAALVLRLLSAGHSVKSLDYQKGIAWDKLEKEGAELIVGSVTDKSDVAKSMQNVDMVFHLAAAFRELNVPDKHYYDVNVNGTRMFWRQKERSSLFTAIQVSIKQATSR